MRAEWVATSIAGGFIFAFLMLSAMQIGLTIYNDRIAGERVLWLADINALQADTFRRIEQIREMQAETRRTIDEMLTRSER